MKIISTLLGAALGDEQAAQLSVDEMHRIAEKIREKSGVDLTDCGGCKQAESVMLHAPETGPIT